MCTALHSEEENTIKELFASFVAKHPIYDDGHLRPLQRRQLEKYAPIARLYLDRESRH